MPFFSCCRPSFIPIHLLCCLLVLQSIYKSQTGECHYFILTFFREAEEEAAAQIEHQKSNSNLAKDGRKFSCGLRFLKKAGDSVSGDSSDVTPERKYSVEQQHRAKPSLKMKASYPPVIQA